jgi:hypothetical protein
MAFAQSVLIQISCTSKDSELVDATLDNGDCVTCATVLQDSKPATLQLGNTTGS